MMYSMRKFFKFNLKKLSSLLGVLLLILAFVKTGFTFEPHSPGKSIIFFIIFLLLSIFLFKLNRKMFFLAYLICGLLVCISFGILLWLSFQIRLP